MSMRQDLFEDFEVYISRALHALQNMLPHGGLLGLAG
jgi:hypothetical protein